MVHSGWGRWWIVARRIAPATGAGVFIVVSALATTTLVAASPDPLVAIPTVSLPLKLIKPVEGNAGTTTVTLTPKLNRAATGDVTVDYTTVDGTATSAGHDYVPVSGTVTIPAGSTTATIAIGIVGDTTAEDYEQFSVQLSNANGATLANATESIQILNDDTPSLSMPAVKVAEGVPAVFAPKLVQRYYLPISLTATTANGTATAPSDYSAVSAPLTFPAGSKAPVNVSVPTVADAVTEPAETFTLTVGGSGVAAPVSKTATIANEICTSAAPPATYDHVVVVVMENKFGYQLNNNPAAPWFNGLVKSCATATAYSANASPSRPNYIAMTAGDVFDCTGSDGPPGPKGDCHPTSGSVFKEVLDSGGTVRDWSESMPTNCAPHTVGEYAVKHNPWPYFTAEAALCNQWNVAMPDPIDTASLPTLTFITPNLCNDTHDCDIATGDAWLAQHIQPILDSPAYLNGSTALMITYDEYVNLPNAFVSRSVVPNTKVRPAMTHYGLLATIDADLGLAPLANAATATSLRTATHM